jgi:hypothetical protein
MAGMSCAERHIALQELKELLRQISHASRVTAFEIEVSAERCERALPTE